MYVIQLGSKCFSVKLYRNLVPSKSEKTSHYRKGYLYPRKKAQNKLTFPLPALTTDYLSLTTMSLWS